MTWTYKLKNAGNGYIVWDGDAMVCDVFMTKEPTIAEGRARLIAQAPLTARHCESWEKDFNSLAMKLDEAEKAYSDAATLIRKHAVVAISVGLHQRQWCVVCQRKAAFDEKLEHADWCDVLKYLKES